MTVLFSSHIIEDVERVSDKIIIIHEGKLISDSTLSELTDRVHCNKLEVECQRPEDAKKLADQFQGNCQDNRVVLDAPDMATFQTQLFSYLIKEQVTVLNLKIIKPSLEEIFVKEVM